MPKHRTKKDKVHAQQLREAPSPLKQTYSIGDIPTLAQKQVMKRNSPFLLHVEDRKYILRDLLKTIFVSVLVLALLVLIWKFQLL